MAEHLLPLRRGLIQSFPKEPRTKIRELNLAITVWTPTPETWACPRPRNLRPGPRDLRPDPECYNPRMKLRSAFLLMVSSAVLLSAQTPEVEITAEPHHHLVVQNPFVRVFKVEVAPHAATLM